MSNEWKIYYKVVKRSHIKREFCSLIAEGKTVVYYPVGKWVSPVVKKSKLFVFDSIDDAVYFRTVSSFASPLYLFECNVEEPVKIKRIARTFFGFSEVRLRSFWKNYNERKNYVPWHEERKNSIPWQAPPEGTYGVKRVKLLRQIPWPNLR